MKQPIKSLKVMLHTEKSIRAEDLTLRQIISIKRYREPRPLILGSEWPACPACHTLTDADYARFCSNCGQRLDWREFHKVSMKEEIMELFDGAVTGAAENAKFEAWIRLEYIYTKYKTKKEITQALQTLQERYIAEDEDKAAGPTRIFATKKEALSRKRELFNRYKQNISE